MLDTTLDVHDLQPTTETHREEVIDGLRRENKRLPSKLFYDKRGSQLFEDICQLDEYYLTRTELASMDEHAAAMARCLGENVVLVELGSGASLKTRILLDHLHRPSGYVPVDISREHLEQSAASINEDYPRLPVAPVCADFTQPFRLPANVSGAGHAVVYFPGSTIGNFPPDEAIQLLRNIREICDDDGGLLIGIDRKKDIATLEAAYNDSEGVTAQFNLNMLSRINDELETNFDEEQFEHAAHFNPQHGRIEMHLVSTCDQTVRLNGHQFEFEDGETICTEFSYKFSIGQFSEMASQAGFRLQQSWSDKEELFSVLYLTAE